MDDDDFAELYGSAAEEPASTVKAPAAANGKGPGLEPAGHTPSGALPAARCCCRRCCWPLPHSTTACAVAVALQEHMVNLTYRKHHSRMTMMSCLGR